MLVYERILNKMLFLFFASRRSMVRRQADNMVISNIVAQYLTVLSTPLHLVIVIFKTIMQNLIVCVMLMVFVGVVVTVSESSTSVVSVYVNTYNGGVGALVNILIVKPLQILDLLFRCIVPWYNAVLWMFSQLFLRVVLPFTDVHYETIPELVGDFTLFTQTMATALATFISRLMECSRNLNAKEPEIAQLANAIPFTPLSLQCIANSNYVTLDLMTPGIYWSKVANHILKMLTISCSWMTPPLNIIMYPLLDFNLYKSVHCLANAILHLFLVLPVTTQLRCAHGKKTINQYSSIEKAVMCSPDWTPLFLIFNSMMRSIGTLVDNWLNYLLLVVERTSGTGTVICDQVETVGSVWGNASLVFETTTHHTKLVGLSKSMYAVTDGVSTAYHSMADGGSTAWSLSTFPFRIDTTLGVAAVRYGEIHDADSAGDTRTGLFGCRCVDEVTDNVHSIAVVCSSVPFFAHVYDDDEEYSRRSSS